MTKTDVSAALFSGGLRTAVRRPADHHVLDVHEAAHFQRLADAGGVIYDGVYLFFAQCKPRVYSHRVAAVYSRPLDVFHDSGYEDGLAVAHCVHLHLAPLEILVYQHPASRTRLECTVHVAHQFSGVLDDLHCPPAQDVARPYQNRVANLLRDVQRMLQVHDRRAGRVGNSDSRQELLEQVPVGRYINGLRRGAEYRQTRLVQRLGQVYRGLAPELHHRGRR